MAAERQAAIAALQALESLAQEFVVEQVLRAHGFRHFAVSDSAGLMYSIMAREIRHQVADSTLGYKTI